MAFRVRSSKFRHVYGDPHRKEKCYECVKISKNAHDGSFCSVNPKFLAYVTESAGGGSFAVLPLQKTGRVDVNTPKVCGHVGPVLDIKWSPFDDHIIASCSDDATIKVWQIPENGVKGNLSDWLVDLHGHQRRVAYLEWHPTAENILLSAGHDHQCILWNTETAEPVNIIGVHTETVFSITWNHEGSLFATTSKDKKIRVIDPRLGETCAETQGHTGPKASKAVFLGDTQKLFTTGFTRLSERQYAVWDIKNMSKPLKLDTIDSSSGVLFPYYDHDTGVIFVAGKGDGNIRYYEMVKDHPYIHYLSQYQSPHPQRALGIMPKRGIDPYRCEIVRFYKIHTVKNLIEPISMIVPRKSEMFQDDLFPPTASATPSLSADEWISGQNREPILVSMKLNFQDGQIVSAPKTTPSKAVQHKDGTLTHAPSITTYKAVRRNITPSTNSAEVRAPVKKTQPGKLPDSVRNIAKLSTENEADKKVNSFESSELQGLESKRVTKNAMIQKQNEPVRVDMKVWAPSIGDTDAKVIRNGSPNTDPEKVHVKKVWALPSDDLDCCPGQVNGKEPTTDPDLRKAYFRQLEEIKSLKEQIIMKDKRIRQLETEMQILKNIQENGESHC